MKDRLAKLERATAAAPRGNFSIIYHDAAGNLYRARPEQAQGLMLHLERLAPQGTPSTKFDHILHEIGARQNDR